MSSITDQAGVEEIMSSKILLADNSPTVRNVTLSLLKKHGYEVISAQDGVEALKKAKADHPDIIFLEDRMAILDGEQVLRELKQDQSLKSIPVVMILSQNEPQRKEQLKQLGSDFFISKPVNPAQILDSAEIFLSKQKASIPKAEKPIPGDVTPEKTPTSGKMEEAKITLPEEEKESEEGLNIVNTSDFVHELGSAPHMPDEEPNHGFEWFLNELKREAQEGESLTSQAGKHSSPSKQEKSSQSGGTSTESRPSEPAFGEGAFDELVKELKYNLGDAESDKKPKKEHSSVESTDSSHFDRLIADLVDRIPQKIAQEIAQKVSPQLLEKIIREELSKVKTGST
jgi:CheY-like chemotaxis protein